MFNFNVSKPNGDQKNGDPNEDHPIIELRSVHKSYKSAAGDFPALKGIDLCICAGEFVSIIGKSGSGKSTLLNMITGIDRPTTGEVFVNGTGVHELNENQLAGWRGGNKECLAGLPPYHFPSWPVHMLRARWDIECLAPLLIINTTGLP